MEGEVSQQHPGRTWVERQEGTSEGHPLKQPPTTSECGHNLLQIVIKRKQGVDAETEEEGWEADDPSRYPQQVCRGLAQLLSQSHVDSESARWLARQIEGRLPPGWGAVWRERGCSELQGSLADQLQLVGATYESWRFSVHDVKGVMLEHASSVTYGSARSVNKKKKNVMCAVVQFHP
jgi:hypothetical protein